MMIGLPIHDYESFELGYAMALTFALHAINMMPEDATALDIASVVESNLTSSFQPRQEVLDDLQDQLALAIVIHEQIIGDKTR